MYSRGKGIFFAMSLMISLLIGVSFVGMGMSGAVEFILFSFIVFGILHLLYWVFCKITGKLTSIRLLNVLIIIGFFIEIIYFITYASGCMVSMWVTLVFSAVLSVTLTVAGVSGYNVFVRRKVKRKNIISFGISVCIICAIAVFFIGEGFDDSYINDYLYKNQSNVKKADDIYKDYIVNGKEEVLSIEYGTKSDKALNSANADLSDYIGQYKGIKKWIRDRYYGYDIEHVALRGKVWYPKGEEQCPVVFIVHGNHNMTVDSYKGYEYLGTHLASRGYVVVSVDENYCNGYIDMGYTNENDARAVLLLENMKQLKKYNYNKKTPLYHKIDFNRIVLAGHSRGGEAVVIAEEFNRLGRNPDDASLTYDSNFNIKGLIAIAPTTDQYCPAGKDLVLKDMNYFLIQGSNDQDLGSFMGSKQYQNTTFSGEQDCFKSYLYIAGANHGQFNTLWGRNDMIPPISLMLNTKNLISGEDQREILTSYMTAFLDKVLRGDETAVQLFQKAPTKKNGMPKTIYMSDYQDSTFVPVADFEEDYDLATTTMENGTSTGSKLYQWDEEAFYESYDQMCSPHCALRIEWKKDSKGYYYINLNNITDENKEKIKKAKMLQFNVMDADEESANKKDRSPMDFSISVWDRQGNNATVSLLDYYYVYPPLQIKLYKLQYIDNRIEYKNQFQTIRIPFKDLKAKNKNLQIDQITDIQFQFDKRENGTVFIDQIGFTK